MTSDWLSLRPSLFGRRGLYAIVDLDLLALRQIEPVPFALQLIRKVPLFAIQVRFKSTLVQAAVATLVALRPVAAERNVLLVANDRVDVALAAGIGAVHLGQDDLRVADARRVAELVGRPMYIGISTHDEAQFAEALQAPVDYVAVGPVFSTQTKANAGAPLGLSRVRSMVQSKSQVGRQMPVVAIGGITSESLAEFASEIDAVAVVTAITPRDSSKASEDVAIENALRLARCFPRS